MTIHIDEKIQSLDGTLLDAVLALPDGRPRGAVLQVHGLTADMDESGFYTDMANALCAAGYATLRFSFRGHGRSSGTQIGMTIAGEMLDLLAAFHYLDDLGHGPVSVVAASFGAVSVCLADRILGDAVDRVVLLNPALDLNQTFFAPVGSWSRTFFGREVIEASLRANGYVDVGGFRLGPVLFAELEAHDPLAAFLASSKRTLVVHGDCDEAVPYEVSYNAAQTRPNCELVTVEGAAHGFANVGRQHEVIDLTVAWLQDRR